MSLKEKIAIADSLDSMGLDIEVGFAPASKGNRECKINNKITGAEAVLLSLVEENVDIVFGYPGGAIMPFYDALYDVEDKIKHILVRHEQGAAHAAQGYARATGRVGVCISTSGPGATNLITGIADAMMDSTPLVCITGQVASDFLGTDAFQEVDIIGVSIPITKWNYQIKEASEIPKILAKAFHIAVSGRPGPVLIDITKNAQFGKVEFAYSKVDTKKIDSSQDESTIFQAAELINNAKAPYILAGHGVLISKAEAELSDLALRADIPVACTLLGLSALPATHKLYSGMLGMHGNYGSNILTNEADVIIAIGMRFDDRVTGNLNSYAKQAKIIHIEIDPSEINKNVQATVALTGDAKAILTLLLKHIKDNTHSEWLKRFRDCAQIEFDMVIKNEITNSADQIKMAEVVHMLSLKTIGDAIIVTDVGHNQMITARYYKFMASNSHITSGGAGTMGFSLPAAIGAKLGMMHKEVISISGDAGFQMNLQELAVIMQENLNVKIIILNNNFLGMVRQWQEMYFDSRYSFTKLINPDFIKIAEAYNIEAFRVTERHQLSEALDRLLKAKNSYLLEVVVKAEELVFPMVGPGEGIGDIRLC